MTALAVYSAQASLILFATLAVLRLAKAWPASWRHAVLSASMFSAALVPFANMGISSLGLTFIVVTPSPAAPRTQPLQVSSPMIPAALAAPSVALAGGSAAVVETSVSDPWHIEPSVVLACLWLIGATCGLLRIAAGLVQLRRIEAENESFDGWAAARITAEVRQRYALTRPVITLFSNKTAPVTWGVFRPRLVLPTAAATWPDERVRLVAAHELAHVRRADWAVHLFAEVQRAIYWFNPLWWIACRRLLEESERAADDLAITVGLENVESVDYAAELLYLTRTFAVPQSPSSALSMTRGSTIERRFAALLDTDLRRTAITWRGITVAFAAFAALMLPMASCRAARSAKTSPASARANATPPITPIPLPATSQQPATPSPGAPAGDIDPPIAKAGGEFIRSSDLDREMSQLLRDLETSGERPDRIKELYPEMSRDLLRNLIDVSLLQQVGREQNIDCLGPVAKRLDDIREKQGKKDLDELEQLIREQGLSFEEVREGMCRDYLTQDVINREVTSRLMISTMEMREFYNEHKENYKREAGIELGEIGLSFRNGAPKEQKRKIEDIHKRLKEGEEFRQLAAQNSDTPSARNGGDVGYILQEDFKNLAKDIVETVSTLEKGQISEIVTRPEGLLIWKILDKHPGGVLSFDLAQTDIYQAIITKRLPTEVRAYLSRLRIERGVEVYGGHVDTGAAVDSRR